MTRTVGRTARTLKDVLEATEAQPLAEITVAMFLLRAEEPRLFVSDDGFTCQVSRLVRSLVEGGVGSYYDHNSGRVKRVYRDYPLRASKYLGETLIETYARFGVQVMAAERRTHLEVANRIVDAAFDHRPS